MSLLFEERLNLFLLNDILWMITKATGKSVYDFQFEDFFRCEHQWQLPSSILAVARVGARQDYTAFYDALEQQGIRLLHSPNEHTRCSELPHWYPLISDMTPRSRWFSEMPELEAVTQEFEWPIFIKGARQTSKHQKHLAIIDGPESFQRVRKLYAEDPILHWQDVVCREYIQLRSVEGTGQDTIPPSFEFRTFWWGDECVGVGRYWLDVPEYHWTSQEKQNAIAIARRAASRVDVPFLVVDVAQRVDGQWIVIECNDGQESGYAGVSPLVLWKNILAVEGKQPTGWN